LMEHGSVPYSSTNVVKVSFIEWINGIHMFI
jgi:hypothetical protein